MSAGLGLYSYYSSLTMTSLRRELADWIMPEQVAEVIPEVLPEMEVIAPEVVVKPAVSVAGALCGELRRGLSGVAHVSVDGFGMVKDLVSSMPMSVKVGGLMVATALATHYVSTKHVAIEAKWAWLRDKLRRKPKVVMAVGSTSKILESRRAGSEESEMTAYKGQCQIGTFEGGRFVVSGAALRFAHNYLVGPDHVLGASNLHAHGKQGWVSLEGKERVPLATDLVAIQLTDAEFATIGVTEVRIGVFDSPIYAQVVGPLGRGTTGALRDDSSCFGRVVYEGTTLPGYSGSAYSSGALCYGMHQCGGQINGGFSTSFIWCLLRIYLRRRDEDTADHLTREFNRGKGIYWSTSHTDPSEVMVRINGRYEYHSVDVMYDVFGSDWMDRKELKRRGRDFQDFKDVEFESASGSGEAKSLKFGASGILENPQPTPGLGPQELMTEFRKLSKKSRLRFRKLLHSSQDDSTMSGQEKSESQTS
nr:MAG: hypothetical protein 1 [Partitiviridae sp.]